MNAIEAIKKLRTETNLPFSMIRQTWVESKQNYELALQVLNDQAVKMAARNVDRPVQQGVVELYSHANGRIGVMVEVNTETDFAARSEPFRWFAHEIALQIAAMKPEYVRIDDIPAEVLAEKRTDAESAAQRAGKPPVVVQMIVEGQMEKFYKQTVLLRQEYIRDETMTVQDLLNRTIASVRENIVIQRFLRWEIEQGEPEV